MTEPIEPAFAAATKKHYPSESDRQNKMSTLAPEMVPFYEAMKSIVDDLWIKDIRFAVFDMRPNANPPEIYVGLTMCCEKLKMKNVIVTDELRKDIAMKITGLTKYKRVIWEV